MSLFNGKLLDSVVLLELKKGRSYHSLATGFFVGFKTGRGSQHRTFLITNRHVVEKQGSFYVSLDMNNGRRKRFYVQLSDNERLFWFSHRSHKVDLALIPVSMKFVQDVGASSKWIPEESFLYYKDYNEVGLSLGDDVIFAGFPLGLSGGLKNYPILRKGSIARADADIRRDSKCFMIDGSMSPGNSGGPVFTKPEVGALNGTKSIDRNYLIGISKGYLNQQVRSGDFPGIGFNVNSGLGLMVPIDYAKTIYNRWVKDGRPNSRAV